MFLKLFSIEWTRLSRRALLWVTLALSAIYMALGPINFYKINQTELLDGTLQMPGMAFDFATALDGLLFLMPILVIFAANLMGNDYSQRTNQHWLMRASRQTSLLAKFAILVVFTVFVQLLAMGIGWGVGAYFKTFVYQVPNLNNINVLATIVAPFYMTLVYLPYIALTLLITVTVRSTFFSLALGLGYTQILELLLVGIFHQDWTKWLLLNLHFSASFLLNSIGNRTAELHSHIMPSIPALVTASTYTLLLLVFAAWMYRRQDVGG